MRLKRYFIWSRRGSSSDTAEDGWDNVRQSEGGKFNDCVIVLRWFMDCSTLSRIIFSKSLFEKRNEIDIMISMRNQKHWKFVLIKLFFL